MKTKNLIHRLGIFMIIILAVVACEEEIDPDFELRDEYIGEWICTENSSLYGTSTYTVSISKNPDSIAFINIRNFYNTGNSSVAVAEVFDNSILIETQNMTTSTGNIEISGSGSASSDYSTFSLVYSADDGSDTDQASAEFIRP